MFSSKTPRDLNHDPHPYVDQWGIDRNDDGDPAGYDFDALFHFDPRPEFDHVQHNEPNPILVAFRARSDKHGMDAEDRANLSRAWLQAPRYYERRLVEGRLSRQERDHARRVLTRLANFSQIEEEPEPSSDEEREYDEYLDQQFWGDH